jgi:hypothetical protein
MFVNTESIVRRGVIGEQNEFLDLGKDVNIAGKYFLLKAIDLKSARSATVAESAALKGLLSPKSVRIVTSNFQFVRNVFITPNFVLSSAGINTGLSLES